MTEEEKSSHLALLCYASPDTRLDLFAQKIKFCCQLCDFRQPEADLKKKEIKRAYLNECIEFLNDKREVLIEPIYALIAALFAHNIFRSIASKRRLYDPDRDEDVPEITWPHMRLVYMLFIKVLESEDFQASIAKKFIDHNFVGQVIDSFASEDHREREILRTTLHRLYAKFISLRAFLRKEIGFRLQQIIYENNYFPGITELLEVVGSISNGLTAPIKQEHIEFLHHILIPLHALPKIEYFHPQLVYCISQYLLKDERLIKEVMHKFFKKWPKIATKKEQLFLDELEEFLDLIHPAQFLQIYEMTFRQMAKCIKNPNSLVRQPKKILSAYNYKQVFF